MKSERFWLFKYFVAGVRPPHPHQYVIFTGEVRCDVPFTFTSVLPPYEHVDETRILATVQPEVRGGPGNHITSGAVAGVYNDVRRPGELANFSFSFVLHHLLVSGKLLKPFHPPLLISGFENIEWGGEVHVENTRPESAPDAVNLV